MKPFMKVVRFGRQIREEDGKKILTFCEKYLEIYKDNFMRFRFKKVLSQGFMPFSFFESALKRKSCFSEKELKSSKAYVDKYAHLLDRILYSIDILIRPTLDQKEDLETLVDLLSFFKKFGYWTTKQIRLIHLLDLRLDLPVKNVGLSQETELIINSHLVVSYFSNSRAISTEFKDNIFSSEPKEVKKVQTSFSLSEMRRILEKNNG